MHSENYIAKSEIVISSGGHIDDIEHLALPEAIQSFPGARYFEEIMLGQILPKERQIPKLP